MTFTQLLTVAIQKAGKQEQLSIILDIAPSALSRRINGETGWSEREINKLLEYVGMDIEDDTDAKKKIEVLKGALRVFMEDKE